MSRQKTFEKLKKEAMAKGKYITVKETRNGREMLVRYLLWNHHTDGRLVKTLIDESFIG